MTWHQVCAEARLKREQRFVFSPPPRSLQPEILLLWLNEQVYALENRCPHQGFPLEQGLLDPEEQSLTCPLHHWRFALADGAGLSNRACLGSFKVKTEADQIWVWLEDVKEDTADTRRTI